MNNRCWFERESLMEVKGNVNLLSFGKKTILFYYNPSFLNDEIA